MGAVWGSWGEEKVKGGKSCGSNAFTAVLPNGDTKIFNTCFIVCM